MSRPNPSLLSSYNGLTDKYLTGYFNNTRIRRHLVKVGLITRNGIIVPDKDNKFKVMRECRQRHSREFLIQPIFDELLDIERQHQIEMKKKLEDFPKCERVHKIKVERSKRCNDDIVLLRSPERSLSPSNGHAWLSEPEVELSESTESSSSSWSNLATGKMEQPVQFPPLYSASIHRTSHSSCHKSSSGNKEQPGSSVLDRDQKGIVRMSKYSSGISPYEQPVISHFVTPVPPVKNKKESSFKSVPEGIVRGKKFHLYVGPSAPGVKKMSKFHEAPAQNNVLIKMVFCHKSVNHSPKDIDLRHEVKVFQQHCEGENICVYKGKLREGEFFQFISRRSHGFPFGLTFYLNGLQVEHLNSCCEFRHQKGSELKGRDCHFSFVSMDRASPCYKCVLAFGLYKKSIRDPSQSSIQPDSSQKQVGGDSMDSEETDTLSGEREDKDKDESETDYMNTDDERGDTESSPSGNEISSSLSNGSSYSHKETSVYSDSEDEQDNLMIDKRTPSPSPRSSSFSSYSSSKDSEEESLRLQDIAFERPNLKESVSSMETNTARSIGSKDSDTSPVEHSEETKLEKDFEADDKSAHDDGEDASSLSNESSYSHKDTSAYSDSEAEEDKTVEKRTPSPPRSTSFSSYGSSKDSEEEDLRLQDSASERHSLKGTTTRITISEDSEATPEEHPQEAEPLRDFEADDKATIDEKDTECSPAETEGSCCPSDEGSYSQKETTVYSNSEYEEDKTTEKRIPSSSPRTDSSSHSITKDSEEEGVRLQDSPSDRPSLEGYNSDTETNAARSTRKEDAETIPEEHAEEAELGRDFEADDKSTDDEREGAESRPTRYRRSSSSSNEGSYSHKETSVFSDNESEEDMNMEKRISSCSQRNDSSQSSSKDSEEEGHRLQDSASGRPSLEGFFGDLQTSTTSTGCTEATPEEHPEEAELERSKLPDLGSDP